jgi:hypothetical protein
VGEDWVMQRHLKSGDPVTDMVTRPPRTGNARAYAVLDTGSDHRSPAQWARVHSLISRELRASDEVFYGDEGRIVIVLHGVQDLFNAAELMEVLSDRISEEVPLGRALYGGVTIWSRDEQENAAQNRALTGLSESIARGFPTIRMKPSTVAVT